MLSNKGRHDTTNLGSSVVQDLKINQRRILIDSLEIGIPAPEQMIALGERQLPNGVKVGQLLNSKTLNYKKFTPHRDGLFCERIFGPVQSFVCACGKKKEGVQSKGKQKEIIKANLLPPLGEIGTLENQSDQSVTSLSTQPFEIVQPESPFCPRCQVEYISKNVRRHRLGYIKLFAPVTHIWYLKGRPSYLSLFLGKRKKAITSLAYCNAYLVEQIYPEVGTQPFLKDTNQYVRAFVGNSNVQIWQKNHSLDLSKNNDKPLFSSRFDTSSSLVKNGFHEDLPLSLKKDQRTNLLGKGVTNVRNRVIKPSTQTSNGTTNEYKYRVSTKLKAVNSFVEPTLCQSELLYSLQEQNWLRFRSLCRTKAVRTKTHYKNSVFVQFLLKLVTQNNQLGSYKRKSSDSITPSTNQNIDITDLILSKSKKEKDLHALYMRAQSLPFLPSLICPFHLRDCLISFLQSLPCKEDIPISIYCQTPRRYPLRDVHKFLAETRSTNAHNQSERVSSESITKFLGLTDKINNEKQVVNQSNDTSQANAIQRSIRYKKVGKSLYGQTKSGQSLDEKNENLFSLRKKGTEQIFHDQVFTPTLSLQPLRKYSSNSKVHSLTATSFFKKYDRPIVVHKVRHTNVVPQSQVNLFQFVDLEATTGGLSSSKKQDLVTGIRELFVRKSTKSCKKRMFVSTGTRKRERVFTKNEFTIKVTNKSFHNKRNLHLLPGYISQNNSQIVPRTKSLHCIENQLCLQNERHPRTRLADHQTTLTKQIQEQNCLRTYKPSFWENNSLKSTATAQFLRNVKIPEQEMKQDKSLSRFALLPLGLRFVSRSNSIRKASLIPLSSNTNHVLAGAKNSFFRTATPEANCFTNQLTYLEQRSTDLLTTKQVLANENQKSLRGILLNTFINMIGSELVDLSLSLCVKRSYTSVLNKKNNWFDEHNTKKLENEKLNVIQSLLPFDTRPSQKPYQRTGGVDTNSRAFLHLSSLERKLKHKHRLKRLTYRYLPILLYARKLKFERKKLCSTEFFLDLPPKRYQYSHGLQFNVSIQTSQERPRILALSKGIASHSFFSPHLHKNLLHTDLQTFFFRESIGTYQARLLHLVFGGRPQNPGVIQWNTTKSFFFNNTVVTVKKQNNDKKESQVSLQERWLKEFDVSIKNKVYTKAVRITKFLKSSCKNNGMPPSLFLGSRFGYTYLLTKRQQIEKQHRFVKEGVDTKSLFWYLCLQSQLQSKQKRTFLPLLHKESTFLQKLGYHSVQRTAQILEAERSAKWNFDTVKAYTKTEFVRKKMSFWYKLCLYQNDIFLRTYAKFNPVTSLKVEQDLVLEPILSETKLRSKIGLKKQSLANLARDTKKNTNLPTSFGSETISRWHIDGAKEILLYTGGGGLESLLKRFNSSLLCQFLLGEIQILRKYYKHQIVIEYNRNKTVARNSLYSPTDNQLNNKGRDQFQKEDLSRVSSLSSSSIVSESILHSKGRLVEPKPLVTGKSTNLLCRRIYRTVRRLKIVQLLMRNKRRPEWMMISVLPVLPPDLRPVLQMGDNLIVASDLNTLYQRVIYRNNRHYKGRFLDFHFVSSIHRLVQDAVDRLIENGKGGSTPFLTPGGRPLKSLSDILKGKRGRFRFNLLGKRVDFSGRSVIVVDPNLKIHECGLPKEMALELYKYILIRQLLLQKRVSSIVNAKRFIKERRPFIWDILKEIIYYHPLLLNRAPTLHRLGIQAFQPKLTLGSAILLHPLVCAGFNADFDGDQMGVHLPLSPQARAEAWDLLWSRNNLLSPATGQPILLPSQDMVLGFYYMTSLLPYGTTNKVVPMFEEQSTVSIVNKKDKKPGISSFTDLLPFDKIRSIASQNRIDAKALQYKNINKSLAIPSKSNTKDVHVFSDRSQLLYAYQKQQIDIHTSIWLKWVGKSENGEKSKGPLELRINTFGDQTQIYPTHQSTNKLFKKFKASFLSFYMRTTVGRVLVNNSILTNR